MKDRGCSPTMFPISFPLKPYSESAIKRCTVFRRSPDFENKNPRYAHLRIFGSLNIEKVVHSCFVYMRDFIPSGPVCGRYWFYIIYSFVYRRCQERIDNRITTVIAIAEIENESLMDMDEACRFASAASNPCCFSAAS